jgi:hypothetical protein
MVLMQYLPLNHHYQWLKLKHKLNLVMTKSKCFSWVYSGIICSLEFLCFNYIKRIWILHLAVSASNDEYLNMAYDSTTLSACNSAALRDEACAIMTHPHDFFEGMYSSVDAILADGFVFLTFIR